MPTPRDNNMEMSRQSLGPWLFRPLQRILLRIHRHLSNFKDQHQECSESEAPSDAYFGWLLVGYCLSAVTHWIDSGVHANSLRHPLISQRFVTDPPASVGDNGFALQLGATERRAGMQIIISRCIQVQTLITPRALYRTDNMRWLFFLPNLAVIRFSLTIHILTETMLAAAMPGLYCLLIGEICVIIIRILLLLPCIASHQIGPPRKSGMLKRCWT